MPSPKKSMTQGRVPFYKFKFPKDKDLFRNKEVNPLYNFYKYLHNVLIKSAKYRLITSLYNKKDLRLSVTEIFLCEEDYKKLHKVCTEHAKKELKGYNLAIIKSNISMMMLSDGPVVWYKNTRRAKWAVPGNIYVTRNALKIYY